MNRNVYRMISIAAAVLLAAGMCHAQWGQAVLEGVCIGTTNDNLSTNSLALDNQGKLHLVYDQVIGTDHNLYYRSKSQGGSWSAPIPLGDQTQIQSEPYLIVQKNTGIPYLVFVQGGMLKLGVGGGAWTYHDLPLSGGATLVGHPAVVVDVNGIAHVTVIVQFGTAYKIGYGLWDTQSFHFQIIPQSDPGPYGGGAAPDIAALSTGVVAVSYRAGDYGTYRIDVAQNYQLGGDFWDVQPIQPAGYNNFTSSIQATANDNLYLACDGNEGWGFPGHVFFCTKPAGQPNWSYPLDITGSLGGMNCRLAMQANGTPHVVWERTSGNIYTGEIIYATNATGSWVSQLLQGGDKYQPSLAVDASGNGSLVFEQYVASQNNDVFYYGYVAPVAPPSSVEIILTPIDPPMMIGPFGGMFGYNIAVTNNTATPQSFQIWTKARLPHGNLYGPLAGPIQINSQPPGTTYSRLRNQIVPANAPGGTYLYIGYAGNYPGMIADSSWFQFTKNNFGDQRLGDGDWLNSGEALRDQPAEFDLCQVSPNPFNPTTVASFELRVASHVRLNVYDTAGRLVATLLNGRREPGAHQETFNGSGLAAGMYLYRLETAEGVVGGKMVLVK
jgi:hypothetical protein